jgi:plasmid maintenance system antidote protein VapI
MWIIFEREVVMGTKKRKVREGLRVFLKGRYGTVQEACFQLGINDGLMSNIINGYRDPSSDIIIKLANIPGFKNNMI